MIGLYIHIPFCKHICSYCDFAKKIPYKNQEEVYINKLIADLNKYKSYNKQIDTIYIGGGTPNYLSLSSLELLFNSIANLNIKYKEYSIECNPELLTLQQVQLFKKYGINRVSLGMQTISPKGLKLLNRHHNKEDILSSVKLLKDNGIDNINIDLIYGYFNESLEDVINDINFILSLDIKHISAYSLILEENTMLYKSHKESELDEDLIADMYNYIRARLLDNSFKQYELSNFSKEGYQSIHNLKYWTKEEYIGVGMSACSYLNNRRITNSYFINNYLNDKDQYIEELDNLTEKKEYIIMGLRRIDGISKKAYIERFNSSINDDFKYQKLIDLGLLIEDSDNIRLTDRGLLLGNVVFEEFL